MKLNILKQQLSKPEYFYNPTQLLKRLSRFKFPAKPILLTLPWGHAIEVRAWETIGKSVWHFGLYDLPMSEVLWRLTEADDTVADIGANIGYVTSLFAKKLSSEQCVWSFEPHPKLFKYLERNSSYWRAEASIQIRQIAISDRNGEAQLILPKEFSRNQGTAYLSDKSYFNIESAISVPVTTLDSCFSDKKPPQVIKIDTEGHEVNVIQGASSLLTRHQIRDIVFEDHSIYPTPTMSLLEHYGYHLFRIKKCFNGVELTDPHQDHELPSREPPNLLATCRPERALRLLHKKGWTLMKSPG